MPKSYLVAGSLMASAALTGLGAPSARADTWPTNKEGGTAPGENKFGVDLSKQQQAETPAWYSPSMYNIVKQNGEDVHIVIQPDKDCVVNSGLGSIRGARIAEMSYSRPRNTQLQRLTSPMVALRANATDSWDDALDLVAQVTCRVVAEKGEDALFVSAFDHGGAGVVTRYIGGHRQTLFRCHEGQKHPHPQSPRLQFRGSRDKRYGSRRTYNGTKMPSWRTR